MLKFQLGFQDSKTKILKFWDFQMFQNVFLESSTKLGSNPTPGIFVNSNLWYRARVVKGSDSKSDEHLLAGVQIPPISFFLLNALHWWPSGLRRYVQVVVSSDAWVRTPPNAKEVHGALAQSEECNVSNVEVPGSKPGCSIFFCFNSKPQTNFQKSNKKGARRELNPWPLAPKARIMPLDHEPWLLNNPYGTRTRNLLIRSQTRYPITPRDLLTAMENSGFDPDTFSLRMKWASNCARSPCVVFDSVKHQKLSRLGGRVV